MGGDFVHVYKNEQGGFCPGGDFVLHSQNFPLLSFGQVHSVLSRVVFLFFI